MAVSFSDLRLAFEFVSSGGMGENQAYLDRQSGKIYWHSEFGDNYEEFPDDIDDKKYILIPDKRELDLGKPLVLDFAREYFRNPAVEAAQQLLGPSEPPDAAIAARVRLMWAMGATSKFIWPIPDKGLKKRIHRVSAPTLVV